MRIDIEYKDILFIREILREKEDLYQKQIVDGYTDTSTPIDTISTIETKQKQINKIYEKLNQYQENYERIFDGLCKGIWK